MRRYWIPKEMLEGPAAMGSDVRLRGDVLHHVRDVCRMHKGSKFEVIVEGQALLVEIIGESKHESMAEVMEVRKIAELPRPFVHLVMSIPRFPVFEAVVEKAVEMGVSSIFPVYSDFSFIRKQEETWTKKRPRFEKIVVSATQQSGRGDLMPIAEPVLLDKFLSGFNQSGRSSGLFAYEGEGLLSAQEGLKNLPAREELEDAFIFVGSEGGFSEREVELFRSVGLKPVTLGAQVLRVETACVALVSIIKYHFDLMR